MEKKNKQIREYILGLIEKNKELKIFQLPSENFIATKFKTSRTTARKELSLLQSQGIIYSVQGSGYFISSSVEFSKLYPIGNETYKKRKVILLDDKNLLFKIADKLSIDIHNLSNENYFSYTKIFENEDGVPRICNNSYILKSAFKNIDIIKITNSLMGFINENNINLDRQINVASVSESNKSDQELLGVKNKTLIPVVYGTIISSDGQYIEIYERRYNPDDFIQNWVKFF
ncbi:GntR family transcriptional regulator [Mesoplasma photuris]|uniref:GntR family transcriptional regulator n=1 Tax=Mesoplasma photuris TaxID=217731 RepID=UPI0004E250FB|nr:GntR family transcriptional regulator [Mesoplasma photuris]